MSVQKAAMFDELADAGKPVAINDYGEVIIDDTTGVIENESAYDDKAKSKLDEFGGAPKRSTTGKKRTEARPQAAVEQTTESTSPEVKPTEPRSPAIPDFDINDF